MSAPAPHPSGAVPLTSMTGFLLQRSGAMLLARAEHAMESHGVRVRSCYVLAALTGAVDLSQQDLAETIGLDPGTMGSLIDEMVAAGLVLRRRSTLDKRRYLINITTTGDDLLTLLMEDVQRIEAEFLSALTSTESAQMRSSLERVLAGRWPDAIRCTPAPTSM